MSEARPLSEEEQKYIRAKAQEAMSLLATESHVNEIKVVDGLQHSSWLNGPVSSTEVSDRCRYFDQFGFLHLPSFATRDEVQAMKHQMEMLTRTWDPAEKTMAFSTQVQDNESQGSDDYFLESASRVHFFAETTALDEHGSLKEEYLTDKMRALNKAGHAMHIIQGAFQDYTVSSKVKALVAELGWKDPVVPQSMYICKNPKIGGTVHSHQDSTFLYTEPRQSCLGLWLALDDATLVNGCLWVRPKSHLEPVRRQFKRNVDYFTQDRIDESSNRGNGDPSQPKMIFEVFHRDIEWEGQLPPNSEPPCHGLLDAGFVPIECKAGDLLTFAGTLDHLSLPNYSDQQRHTFQLHLVEGEKAGVSWSRSNWLQYPKEEGFVSIRM
ncbi:phytanoyl-CoA dioxygenase [Fragilaria crotonensis]|nr:phytanoyl-CoA dioxygenase [Fragilaria crotonensis]KAI2506089.1 phytanoyl-CoA dioxygenase [Fragilaria crotonensis]